MTKLFFKFWDLHTEVILKDDEFRQSLFELWKPFWCNSIEEKSISYRYRLEKLDEHKYQLNSNNSPPSQSIEKEQVLPLLNSQLCFNLLQSSKSHFYFHSSAFLTEDKTIVLLIGDRGNGKTSLLLRMLQNGNRFICNDIFPLVPKTNLGEPFPIGFFAEKSILRHFPALSNKQLEFKTPKANQKAALFLPERDYPLAKQKFYSVSTICFLNQKACGSSELHEISKSETIGELFTHWRNKHLFRINPLESISNLAENANSFRLKNVNFEQSLQLIEGICNPA
jgi:hypothetical protein